MVEGKRWIVEGVPRSGAASKTLPSFPAPAAPSREEDEELRMCSAEPLNAGILRARDAEVLLGVDTGDDPSKGGAAPEAVCGVASPDLR